MPVFPKRSVSPILSGSLVFAATLLLTAGASYADPVVQFDISVTGGTDGPFVTSFDENGTSLGGATPQLFNFNNPFGIQDESGNGEWAIEQWNFNADNDPSGTGSQGGARLGSGFTIKNLRPDGLTPADNHLYFSIMITMDIPSAPTALSFSGNGGMTLTIDDSPVDFWGLLTAIGSPFWSYRVNGADVASLFPDGSFMGGSDGPSTPSTSANLTPSQFTGVVDTTINSIGIRMDFDLTPGERVTFNGLFRVNPTIPGPAGLALLGLAGVAGRRRRR